MNAIGVIPARFAAQRLPGKPLVPIAGKPLLQWVIEGAKASKKLSQIYVATDHPKVAELADSLGVEAVMTDPDLPSGTDRVWAVAKNIDCDVVLNIQGDEPLISGEVLDLLAESLHNPEGPQMATLASPMAQKYLLDPHKVKVIMDHKSDAIYFSRFAIPYSRGRVAPDQDLVRQHIGMYGFQKKFLGEFCDQLPTALEKAESLEQLRALYMGAKIRVIVTNHQSWGVDTPDDVERVAAILNAEGADGE